MIVLLEYLAVGPTIPCINLPVGVSLLESQHAEQLKLHPYKGVYMYTSSTLAKYIHQICLLHNYRHDYCVCTTSRQLKPSHFNIFILCLYSQYNNHIYNHTAKCTLFMHMNPFTVVKNSSNFFLRCIYGINCQTACK